MQNNSKSSIYNTLHTLYIHKTLQKSIIITFIASIIIRDYLHCHYFTVLAITESTKGTEHNVYFCEENICLLLPDTLPNCPLCKLYEAETGTNTEIVD